MKYDPRHEYGIFALVLIVIAALIGAYFFGGTKAIAFILVLVVVAPVSVWLYWKIKGKK